MTKEEFERELKRDIDSFAHDPEGFADYPVGPEAAFYSADFRQFLLPYEAVRTAADPDRALLEFLQSSYAAAADLAKWDRAALEDDPQRWRAEAT